MIEQEKSKRFQFIETSRQCLTCSKNSRIHYGEIPKGENTEIQWKIIFSPQYKPSQEVPQWHANYFELQEVLTSGSRKTFAPSFNYSKELKLGALFIIRDNLFWPTYSRASFSSLTVCSSCPAMALWSPKCITSSPAQDVSIPFLLWNFSCMQGSHMY